MQWEDTTHGTVYLSPGWLKNQKWGAPLKISPRTTTDKKKNEKNTIEPLSVAVMVSPVTASSEVASATTAIKLQALMGSPLPLHQSTNGCGKIQGVLWKILVLPTQSQHPNELHARANTTIGNLNSSNQRWPVPPKQNWKAPTHNYHRGISSFQGGLFEIVLNLRRQKQRSWGFCHWFMWRISVAQKKEADFRVGSWIHPRTDHSSRLEE